MQKTIYATAYRGLIGELRNARRGLGLRQEDVAKKLQVSRHWVHKIETCAVRLDVLQLVRMCQIYGIDAGRRISRLAEELSDEDASLYLPESVGEGALDSRRWARDVVFGISRIHFHYFSTGACRNG